MACHPCSEFVRQGSAAKVKIADEGGLLPAIQIGLGKRQGIGSKKNLSIWENHGKSEGIWEIHGDIMWGYNRMGNIWDIYGGFQKVGVPQVIIHFIFGISIRNHHFWVPEF